jgi:hypothetical protein
MKLNELILLIWLASSSLRCHFGIPRLAGIFFATLPFCHLVWPASSLSYCHFGISFGRRLCRRAAILASCLAGVFIAALPSWHLAGLFVAKLPFRHLVWLASSSPNCHFGISFGRATLPFWHLVWPASSLPRCHFGILFGRRFRRLAAISASSSFGQRLLCRAAISASSSFGRRLLRRAAISASSTFGQRLLRRAAILASSCLAGVFFAALPFRHPRLAGVFHRRATIAASSFSRRRQSPRYLLSSWPALSIAAPTSLILAGFF